MTSKRLLVLGAAIAIAFAYAVPAHAVIINFTVDTIGNGDVATPAGIAPTAGNIGKYTAGSYVALSGNISGTASGVSFGGAFTAQKAVVNPFSTGNPGSLLAFYGGNLLADLDVKANSIAFPGGSTVTANNYTGTYPVKGGPAVALTPAIGGGAIGVPGSDPANYGAAVKITALFGIVTVANGTAGVRDSVLDVNQTTPLTSQTLSSPLGTTATFTTKAVVSPEIAQLNFDYNLKGGTLAGSTIPDLVGRESITNTQSPNTGTQLGTLKSVLVDPVRQIYNFYITVPVTASTQQSITGAITATINVGTTGQVAAYALNVQVPEPATLALAGFAAVPLGFLAWRRRRRA